MEVRRIATPQKKIKKKKFSKNTLFFKKKFSIFGEEFFFSLANLYHN